MPYFVYFGVHIFWHEFCRVFAFTFRAENCKIIRENQSLILINHPTRKEVTPMMQDLSMHIIDIVQNSIKAGATLITIIVTESPEEDLFAFSIEDNGKGMDRDTLRRVRDPFVTSRTTRKVGLGIPLLEQTCTMCEGSFNIESTLGKGTKVTASMRYSNIDRPPVGDLSGCIYMTIVTNPSIDFLFKYDFNDGEFVLDTREVKKVLGGVPLDNPEVSLWIKDAINEGISFERQ